MLEAIHLTKAYDELLVLDDASFTIKPNSVCGLLGPNGSGKTTIIKLINDLIQPTGGHILFKGNKLSLNDKEKIAYLPEKSALNMSQSVRSAMTMYKDFFIDFSMADALHILKVFEIPTHKRLAQLSKGQRGKVQLALTLGRKAELYILDEPLDGMDPASRDLIMKIVMKYKKVGASVIISTHQITDIESYLDDVILLKAGKVIETGSAKALETKYKMTLSTYFKEVYKYDDKII